MIEFLENKILPIIQENINQYINHILLDLYKLNSSNLSNNNLNLMLIYKIDNFLMKQSYKGGYSKKNKKYSKIKRKSINIF